MVVDAGTATNTDRNETVRLQSLLVVKVLMQLMLVVRLPLAWGFAVCDAAEDEWLRETPVRAPFSRVIGIGSIIIIVSVDSNAVFENDCSLCRLDTRCRVSCNE